MSVSIRGTDGSISWVTRNSKGDVLDKKSKWIRGSTTSSDVEFQALVEFTSVKPKVGNFHTICNDNDGNIFWPFHG